MARDQKIHLLLLLLVTIVFIWSVIKPEGYLIWVAEVLPMVVVIVIAIAAYKKFRMTTLSYSIIALLSIITFIGGHYMYSKVPLFDWIKDTYDLKRNHYDRFGHLIKGLIAIPMREILIRKTPLSKTSWLFAITVSISLALGALYEIVEWISAVIAKKIGKSSEDFLGMQGDKWDAQWDMALLLLGSILALLLLSKLHNKALKRTNL
ncbi:MAG: DUF2238 domain-containing protein [Paenisporosarcina sp.]